MATSNWIPLTEYSSRYKVSISTLRRRIRAGDVEQIYQEGRYLLKDAPLSQHKLSPSNEAGIQDARVTVAPPQTAGGHPDQPLPSKKATSTGKAKVKAPAKTKAAKASAERKELSQTLSTSEEVTPHQLLSEIKKAYMLILQEKEEQIINLKEEVTDLRTLVKVLENEAERLRSQLNEADSWFEQLKFNE